MKGLHIVGDLFDCACPSHLLCTSEEVLRRLRAACTAAELTVVGHAVHHFEGAGYTLALLLAESHITLHTWPEHSSVAMDVYVCNHTRDNVESAHRTAQAIVQLFASTRQELRVVHRGDIASALTSQSMVSR